MNIPIGTELLVWYEDKYEDYFGIPIVLRNGVWPSSHPGMNCRKSRSLLKPSINCMDKSLIANSSVVVSIV